MRFLYTFLHKVVKTELPKLFIRGIMSMILPYLSMKLHWKKFKIMYKEIKKLLVSRGSPGQIIFCLNISHWNYNYENFKKFNIEQ